MKIQENIFFFLGGGGGGEVGSGRVGGGRGHRVLGWSGWM